MTAQDVFGLVLRVVGLALVLYGIRALVGAITIQLNPAFQMMREVGTESSFALPALITALVALAVGAYLLRGAPGLMGYSYPRSAAA